MENILSFPILIDQGIVVFAEKGNDKNHLIDFDQHSISQHGFESRDVND